MKIEVCDICGRQIKRRDTKYKYTCKFWEHSIPPSKEKEISTICAVCHSDMIQFIKKRNYERGKQA